TGLILDSVSRGRAEQKRIFYLSMPSGQVERERATALGALKPEPDKTPRAA
ncbi:MAG: glycosyl transferase, partial [Mesorhizobium sp.]